MTTTHAEWPTQVRLPGQAAAPEGPIAMHVMYVMHHAFRRDLDAFARAAQVTPTPDRDTWKALADRWELFAEVLHEHHTGEDTGLWPLLMGRADDAGREVLEAMEAEHSEIDPLLEACRSGFQALAAVADDDVRAALVVSLTAARESLGRHLAHEETEAIALMQRLMTPEDWHRVDEEHFKKKHGPGWFAKVVPWAAHGLSREHRAQAFAEAGKPFEVLWWLTRRGFERRERRAFRHLAP
jgi:hemerythrin-like domain-containing protein